MVTFLRLKEKAMTAIHLFGEKPSWLCLAAAFMTMGNGNGFSFDGFSHPSVTHLHIVKRMGCLLRHAFFLLCDARCLATVQKSGIHVLFI
jgi:hypothetical protein